MTSAEQPPRIAFIDLAAQQRRIEAQVRARIDAVLAHGAYVMGPEVTQLEDELAERGGARYAVSCASGTDALILSLLALGVGPGDAVLVPTFTFVATAEAVALIGATPVFVDVEPTSANMGGAEVLAALQACKAQGLDPVGVIAVDLFGHPADHDAIAAAAGDRWVVVDAAQSFGASVDGRPVGSTGVATCTSFFPAKPLGCYGDGGAVLTDDEAMADALRSLRVHGQGADKYDNVRIGINGRLDTIQAAVLLEKLVIFDDEIRLRQAVADRYAEGLAGFVDVPQLQPGTVATWAQYTVRDPERDELAASLADAGVPTAVYYPTPLHRQTAYHHFPSAGSLATADWLSGVVLSLPMHPYLTEPDQSRVIAAVRRVRS